MKHAFSKGNKGGPPHVPLKRKAGGSIDLMLERHSSQVPDDSFEPQDMEG